MRTSVAILFITVLVLFTIGSIAIYSLDFAKEYYYSKNSNLFEKYVINIILGVIAFLTFMFFMPQELEKYYSAFYILAISVLIIPFFFPSINGSHRWIMIGNFSFQPSEISKIFLILFFSIYVKNNKEKMKTFLVGVVEPFLFLSLPLLLIALEPDLSTSILIFLTIFTLLYFGGARLVHLFSVVILIVLIGFLAIQFGFVHSYQLHRLSSYFSNQLPWQLEIAMKAISNGGIIGTGPALGKFFLTVPAAESDFIIAVIGENLGFIGILVLLTCYFLIAISLIRVSEEINNEVIRYFTWGYTSLMFFHVIFNTGVVSGMFPITGIPLPFVSYGGSSLLSFSIGLGIIISVFFNELEGTKG
ncbi:FtsW/RodA/SpoVE family cell cycle protein [Thermosipho atlanticus]|uniref:Probable peptidoglycan glycosyltransferase FtsW n=1 Tax=Thermosipho atlanticus DSM 15807 TaxID=1123380 RepID=A0A1M5TJI1_9BACT|nr:FtsW/RodA/SpoVE family cell cycle protein [Thermosipho atlanticus]SHH50859.1 cell division protein FtsW [Thermosipho atlanticus DSM 15807]